MSDSPLPLSSSDAAAIASRSSCGCGCSGTGSAGENKTSAGDPTQQGEQVAGSDAAAASTVWQTFEEQTGINLAPAMQAVEAELARVCADNEPFLAATSSHMAIAGGKRFRPALVLLAGLAGGADLSAEALAAGIAAAGHAHPGDATTAQIAADLITAAVIVELTHMATLYHDDVIDGADARRGQVSAHIKWSNTVAILSGDWLLARASELSCQLGLHVTAIMSRTIADLARGQIQEVITSLDAKQFFPQERQTPSIAKYMQAIYGKTASLIKAACLLGGVVTKMSDEAIEALGTFGYHLGLAFQIADDVLDIEASGEQSGKVQGTDLLEGVQTLPVLYALADLEGTEQGEELFQWVENPTPETVANALALLQGSSYVEDAREAAFDQVEQAAGAIETLAKLGVSEQVLVSLKAIAAQACDRLN